VFATCTLATCTPWRTTACPWRMRHRIESLFRFWSGTDAREIDRAATHTNRLSGEPEVDNKQTT